MLSQWGLVKDGSLEDSADNYSFTWNITHIPVWYDVLCTLENCDGATMNSPGPHSGRYFAWFQGSLGKNFANLSQQILVPGMRGKSVYFCFWLQIESTGPNTGLLRVWQDDKVIMQFTHSDVKDFAKYNQTCVWLNHDFDDTVYTFRFEHSSYRDPQFHITHFSVDDISTKIK